MKTLRSIGQKHLVTIQSSNIMTNDEMDVEKFFPEIGRDFAAHSS
jgi:hypothetical protein